MSDLKPPIEPQDYLYGVKVVDIGDIRVARGATRRTVSTCGHRNVVYCERERRVWCSDCESEIESFDAFVRIAERMDGHIKSLLRREQAIKDAESHSIRSRAAKVMDEAWRSTKTAPLCPHCSTVILPDDISRGVATASKELAIASRKRKEQEQRR